MGTSRTTAATCAGLLLGALALGAGAPATQGSASEPADLVLLNARVYTVDAARSWAEALAVRGRIDEQGISWRAGPEVSPGR